MRQAAIAPLLILAVCTATSRPAAATPWVEIRSPHFTVVTDAGEKTGRNVAWQFEQIHATLQRGWPWLGDQIDRPIVVYGAKDEKSMRGLLPQYWEKNGGFHPVGQFATAPDRYCLVLQTDIRTDGPVGVNPYHEAYWSYGAVALQSSSSRGLPLWFTTGFEQIISNTNVINTEVQFGRALPNHLDRLRGLWPYTLDQLFRVTEESPEYRVEDKRWDYDAESWALVQYLLFGGVDITNRDANANHLANELLKGRRSDEVVTEVFGSVAKLQEAVRVFVSQGVTHYMSVKVDATIATKDFEARAVPTGEEMAMRATLHLAMNRPADARTASAEATKADAALAGPFDIEGVLLEREKKLPEARAAFEQAVAKGSTSFYTYYRLASLMWTQSATTPDLEKAEELAAKATSLNDGYPWSQAYLASLRLRLGKAGGAVSPAMRAIALRPDQPSQRLTLAEALFRLGKKDDAIKMAQTALAVSRTDDDRQRAQQALDRYSQ